ncbi:MAG TPA: hypothetical protein ENN68_06005 [Methanomicrobia archaeon]|nr:hypothetical protein [Methanomicrobia archaeon]
MSTRSLQTELEVYESASTRALVVLEHPRESGTAVLEEAVANFPFSLTIADRVISTIIELTPEARARARTKQRRCSLCGNKEVAYEKQSGGFSHLICKNCAIHYIRDADALQQKAWIH